MPMFTDKSTGEAEKFSTMPASRSARGLVIQRKLEVGAVNDPLEHEADSVADKVMRMPDQPFVQRRCASCDEQERRRGVQRKEIATNGSGASASEVPAIVHEALSSSGQPIDTGMRTFMESRFGYDFGHVRVHTDARAAESAQAVNAHAYTVGRNVVFGAGKYAPDTSDGQRLMAHELTHVVQQGGNTSFIQRMLACPSRLSGQTPAGWQSYHGDSSVFHCGFRGILEDRIPTRDDPQNECFYDHSGVLVDQNHPFSGCRGTPNQYDSSINPLLHTFIDSGGITRAGLPAFSESRVYDFAVQVSRLESEIRRLYGFPY
jgi:hypothetical protein